MIFSENRCTLFRIMLLPGILCGRSRLAPAGHARKGLTIPERHVSHSIESLDTKSLGLPTARTPAFVRHLYRSARKLLRSIIARIDLSQFPGSCCG